MRDHPNWSPKRIILEAAEFVDSRYVQKSSDPGVIEENQKNKERIPNVPTAKRRAATGSESKPKTPAEIVAEQQKIRSR
jgi:hypothetical protein